MSYSLWLHGLYSPWNSPGQNTGVGSLSLLQGIFPTQRLNPGLLHCRQILYQLSHKGSPLLPLTLALGQTTGREHSPAYQQKIGLKIHRAWPCPPEQEPGLLTAGTSQSGNFHKPLILIHQRADRTKPPSQKTNQNWSCGSQPCLTQWNYEPCHRAMQNGRVMVDSSDKMWSTGEGNGKPLQHSCLENPMNCMKRQKFKVIIGAAYIRDPLISSVMISLISSVDIIQNFLSC